MSEIHFPVLDLNLLKVFDAMVEETSVTRAGGRLGLTQSAVSHALGRLRRLLDDDLFVRGPDGMRPTAKALEIAPRIRQGLQQLQLAVTPATFNPAQTRRRFTIATSSYISATLIPAAAALIRRDAPGVELRLRPLGSSLADDLQAGRIDLAISAFGVAGPRFAKEGLFRETGVWCLRADHPAAQAELTLEVLASLPHVLMASVDEGRVIGGSTPEGGLDRRVIWDEGGVLDEMLSRRALSRSTCIHTPDAVSALAMAANTDMAALVPRRLAAAFAGHFRLKLLESPYPSPPSVIEMLWRRDLTGSPPLQWLRGRLKAAGDDL